MLAWVWSVGICSVNIDRIRIKRNVIHVDETWIYFLLHKIGILKAYRDYVNELKR